MDLAEKNILAIIKNSSRITSIIQTIGLIKSENLFLTGGSLRNVIWNYLHFYSEDNELEDCDIIFYNQREKSRSYEAEIQLNLTLLNPKINWSVKNQARMHIRNNHAPYSGIFSALSAFPETCSAIALDSEWNIISPYGLIDLYNLMVVPTKFCLENELEVYKRRMNQKKWLEKWPLLKTKKNDPFNIDFSSEILTPIPKIIYSKKSVTNVDLIF